MSQTGFLQRLSPRTLLFAAVVMLTCAVKAPGIDQIDGALRVQLAVDLTQGNLNSAPDADWPMFFARGRDDRSYSIYGLGQPLLLVPLVALTGMPRDVKDSSRGNMVRKALIALAYTIAVNLALAGAVFGALRQFHIAPHRSALLTLMLLACTPWLIWGLSMQEEALVAALLASAFYCLLRRLKGGGDAWAAVAGALTSFTANLRPNAVFMAAVLCIWLACSLRRQRLRTLAAFLAGSAPSLVLFFWWNTYRFGNPWTTGWEVGHDGWSLDAGLLVDLLFLPDFGLIWFAPLLLLLPWTTRRLRLAAWLALVGFLLHAVLLAGYSRYVGHAVGVAWGPRYFMHGVLLVGPVLCMAWLHLRRSRLRLLVFSLLILSAAVQWAGAVFPARLEYAQDTFRTRQGLEPMQPYAWLPRRFANIYWGLVGELEHRSFPGDPGTGDRAALAPDLLPARLAVSERLRGTPALAALVWLIYASLIAALGATLRLLCRPRPPTGASAKPS